MGYIFDALNKQRGESPAAEAPPRPATQGPVEPTHAATPLADALAAADSTATPAPAPLRLADLQPQTQTVDSSIALAVDAEETAPTQPVEDRNDTPAQTPVTAVTALAPDQPKPRGLWRWLVGKFPIGRIDDRLVTLTSPASAVAEEYRSIRTSILARNDNQHHLVHTITSATPQEGKTITCVNLGLSFAELRNRKTVIVECDLRLPTFSKLLSCDADKPGLIDYLRGQATLSDVIQQVEGSALHIIPAGGRVSDEAVQLLSSTRMSQLIQALRAKYDHVLIDTPPVLQLADAGILGSQSEGVLLVARMRRTPRTLVEQAVNTLSSYNAEVNGIIATDNPRNRGRGYGYGYKYGYGYGYGYGYTADHNRKRRKNRSAA